MNGYAGDYVFVVGDRVVAESSFAHRLQARVWARLLAKVDGFASWDLMRVEGGVMMPVSNEHDRDVTELAA